MDPGQAREAFDYLITVCLDARSRPLPFGPETSRAIYLARRQNKNEIERARAAWNQQGVGPPGEGDRPAPQLAWRDRDPFLEETVDIDQPIAPANGPLGATIGGRSNQGTLAEWRELADWIYQRVDDWFNSAEPVNLDG